MKKILAVAITVLFFLILTPSYAFSDTNKDSKKTYLENAIKAEKQHDNKSALSIYEKTMFKFRDDKAVLEAFANFCERQKYYDKAAKINQKLYILTKDENYLFKKYYFDLEDNNISTEKLGKIINDAKITILHHRILTDTIKKKFPDKSKTIVENYNYFETRPRGTPPSLKDSKTTALYKKNEQNLYKALDARDFKKAENYLNSLLKEAPNDEVLLHLRIDLAVRENDFSKALLYFNELHKKSPITLEDEKILAFLHSKTNNPTKSIEIIETLLKKGAEDEEILGSAIQYSIAQRNWDKALYYNDKLLAHNPLDENLLRDKAYFYEKKGNLPEAVKSYKKLMEQYPQLGDKFELFNLSLAAKDFEQAQTIIKKLYEENPNDKQIINLYLVALLGQNKIDEAAAIVRKHKLEDTKEGAEILGDESIKNKDFFFARNYYSKAITLDKENIGLKFKLAQSYKAMKNNPETAQAYYNILAQDPKNKEARLGLGYINIEEKFFPQARKIFRDILAIDPNYTPAKMGIVHSYAFHGDSIDALRSLKQVPSSDDSKLFKAQTYYNMGMLSSAKQTLNGVVTKEAEALKNQIKDVQALRVSTNYTFFNEVFDEEFDLDYDKYGINAIQGIKHNLNVFADCNLYSYNSGKIHTAPSGLHRDFVNNTTELKIGVMGRPKEKYEFRADFGAKIFQFWQGGMLITDSWIKKYIDDNSSIKFGFFRNNVEQTYLSAVGIYIDNVFTGQIADNRLYTTYERRLPKQFYTFGTFVTGEYMGQNLRNNPYLEGTLGLGRIMYNNPENKWVNLVTLDATSLNTGFRFNNFVTIFNAAGTDFFGGYFCPKFFTNNMANLRIEGQIKKMRYGLKYSGGYQYEPKYQQMPKISNYSFIYSPYIAFNLNDNLTANLTYSCSNLAMIVRNIFMVNFTYKFGGSKKQTKK